MNDKLKTTLKAWPAITAATIGISLVTQWAAKLAGMELPDQEQMTLVRNLLLKSFESWRNAIASALVVLQVLLQAPLLEEPLFRWLGWAVPTGRGRRGGSAAHWTFAAISSVAFSAAHYVDYTALATGGGFRWLPPSSAMLALVFFGLAQCWLYRKTQRLWCPMLNHFLFNLANLVLMFAVPD